MKLWKIALGAVAAIVVSCGTYTKQPVASHIVAVTTAGDTILVAIDKIRPNMYRSYYPVYSSYNYYRPYYYGQQEYQFRYSDNRGSRGSSGGSKSGGGNVKINPPPVKTTPDIITRPSGEVLLKGKR
jgi:hypothetical protein